MIFINQKTFKNLEHANVSIYSLRNSSFDYSRCKDDIAREDCEIVCDKYIYPILDWENHAGDYFHLFIKNPLSQF